MRAYRMDMPYVFHLEGMIAVRMTKRRPERLPSRSPTSRTKRDHELLLLKTNLKPEQFPMDESGARVDEEKVEGRALGGLTKGETETHARSLHDVLQ
jgi:hypothetical protein